MKQQMPNRAEKKKEKLSKQEKTYNATQKLNLRLAALKKPAVTVS